MKGYLVIGTDTGVGKTLISAALLHKLAQTHTRVAGYKPVAAGLESDGSNEDVELLRAFSQPPRTAREVCTHALQAACAPHIAADLEMENISLPAILQQAQTLAAQSDALVVEGAGGFIVPLSINPRVSTADMFVELHRALGLPVVQVVGMRLGCINHALLTAEAIAARGLPLAGWVANCVQAEMAYLDENILTLQSLLPAPCLGVVPFMGDAPVSERVARAADILKF